MLGLEYLRFFSIILGLLFLCLEFEVSQMIYVILVRKYAYFFLQKAMKTASIMDLIL